MKKNYAQVFFLALLCSPYTIHTSPEKLIATATDCRQMHITPSMLAVFNQYAQTLPLNISH